MSSLAPPRTPTTSVMGPPSDTSTPFPHMANASTLPPHLQKSFPTSTSSHTQSPLLQLSSPMGMGMHPPYHPTPIAPPAPSQPKKRAKKAAAPKQQQQQPAAMNPSPQFPMNGPMHPMNPMYSMATPSMMNQFAPPPGSAQTPPTIEMTGQLPPNGIPPNGLLPNGMTMQQYHAAMRHHQMMMHMHMQQQQQMRQNGQFTL